MAAVPICAHFFFRYHEEGRPTHDADVRSQRNLEVEFRWGVDYSAIVGDGELKTGRVGDWQAGASMVGGVRYNVADGERGIHRWIASIGWDDGWHAELKRLALGRQMES